MLPIQGESAGRHVIRALGLMKRVVMPWERIVAVCQKFGVLSLVDGAHSIGQHKVDVVASRCDFFVTVRYSSAFISSISSDLLIFRTAINGSIRTYILSPTQPMNEES